MRPGRLHIYHHGKAQFLFLSWDNTTRKWCQQNSRKMSEHHTIATNWSRFDGEHHRSLSVLAFLI